MGNHLWNTLWCVRKFTGTNCCNSTTFRQDTTRFKGALQFGKFLSNGYTLQSWSCVICVYKCGWSPLPVWRNCNKNFGGIYNQHNVFSVPRSWCERKTQLRLSSQTARRKEVSKHNGSVVDRRVSPMCNECDFHAKMTDTIEAIWDAYLYKAFHRQKKTFNKKGKSDLQGMLTCTIFVTCRWDVTRDWGGRRREMSTRTLHWLLDRVLSYFVVIQRIVGFLENVPYAPASSSSSGNGT